MAINKYDTILNSTYEKLKAQTHSFQIEPFEIVETVHKYRMYWKPEKVRTLLLAESHVTTSHKEYLSKHSFNTLIDYPENFVRFVYCLSYGDNNSLSIPCSERNGGTPQFWALFNETVAKKFKVTNNTDKQNKSSEKILLLEQMKRCGIWLLDCSITGVYVPAGQAPSIDAYSRILTTSYDEYCEPIIEVERPEQIIVIGKRVYDLLQNKLPVTSKNNWIHQPNAKLKKEHKRTLGSIGYIPATC